MRTPATPIPATVDPEPGSPLAPTGERERLLALDALRGVALLGILMVNIWLFAYPFSAMMSPTSEAVMRYTGAMRGINLAVWLFQHIVFEMKMMAIFSMLFGAGLVLMAGRAQGKGFGWIYYRRMTWLLVLGLLHAYLLWYGDILTLYAICGLLLYPLRNLRPSVLIGISIPLLIIPVLIMMSMGLILSHARERAQVAEAMIAAGETPGQWDAEMRLAWKEARQDFDPTPEMVDREVAAFRGSAGVVLRENARLAATVQVQMGPMWGIWRALGLMLLGMALMKLAVFSAARSPRFYVRLALMGYGIGLPLVLYGAWDQVASDFDPLRLLVFGWHFNEIGSIFVALGHISIIMLVCRSGMMRGLVERFAAVGRLALTNYLAQTIISTTFFFGWGLGFFASIERAWLPLIVISVWAVQLAWSPWWLARFRYGPAEWLWRTLTYFRLQPMRRQSRRSSF